MIPQTLFLCAFLAAASAVPYLPAPVAYAKAPLLHYGYKAPLAYATAAKAPLAYAPVVKAPLAYAAPVYGHYGHGPLVAAPAVAHAPVAYGGLLGHGLYGHRLYGHGSAVYAPGYVGATKYGYGKVLL